GVERRRKVDEKIKSDGSPLRGCRMVLVCQLQFPLHCQLQLQLQEHAQLHGGQGAIRGTNGGWLG
ncbi:MAG: hypothetical protein K2L53_03900, partial [Clostridia bacterium]|nr:hypothetical protein [Clostridia bacterium]